MKHVMSTRVPRLAPLAAAALLALAPPAMAGARHWTFISGCGSADWFGTTSGNNSQGMPTCWAPVAGGLSGMPVPTLADDAFIVQTGATQQLLVNFAAPVRGPAPVGSANSLTMYGSDTFAAGLTMDRGTLVLNRMQLGAATLPFLGRFDQSGSAAVSSIGGVSVLAGEYNLNGGTLAVPATLALRAQAVGATFNQRGGSLAGAVVDIGSEFGGAASFNQLAGSVTSTSVTVGSLPGTGSSTLAITGGTWTNSGATTVGAVGLGTLSVAAGRFATGSLAVGVAPGSGGAVQVSGSAAELQVTGTLSVGGIGSAALVSLTQGARLTAGNVLLDTAPDAAVMFVLDGADTRAEVTTLFTVGNFVAGSASVRNGAELRTQVATLGAQRQSVGTMRVAGAGTRWTAGGGLVAGGGGSGTLVVEDGAQVGAAAAALGEQRSGRGDVTLRGAGTVLQVDGLLSVGQSGRGSLRVEDGAVLQTASAAMARNTDARGSVTVAGGTWNNRGSLAVGNVAQGSLTVQGGGRVASGALTVAEGEASSGALSVRGSGSTLQTEGLLNVGRGAAGSFTLARGASALNGSATFGELASGSGSGSIGGGTQWTVRNDLVVGGSGRGTLAIAGGATVTANALQLGRDGGGSGELTLGGSLAVTDAVVVGGAGEGRLVVGSGGQLSSGSATIGQAAKGSVQLAAAQGRAQWTVAGPLSIGDAATATLAIGSGARVQVGDLTRVGDFGSLRLEGGTLATGAFELASRARFDWQSGTLAVTGFDGLTLGSRGLPTVLSLQTGQRLQVDSLLSVFEGGELQLRGGQVQAGRLGLAGGRVSAGADQSLNLNAIEALVGFGRVDASVGGGARSQIIADGGELRIGNAAAADGFSFQGEINVGTGTLRLADADLADLGVLTRLEGSGRLAADQGSRLRASGRLVSAGEGAVVEGRFVNEGAVDALAGALRFTGDVVGGGSFAGTVLFDAGFGPGDGLAAAVRFGGGTAVFGAGSMLTLDIDGTGLRTYDRLLDLGTLSFAGGLTLAFGDGFQTTGDVRLSLLDFDVFSGAFDPGRITITGIDATRVDTSQLARTGVLLVSGAPALAAVSPVPEPATLALWAAGLGLLGWRARGRYAAGAASKP